VAIACEKSADHGVRLQNGILALLVKVNKIKKVVGNTPMNFVSKLLQKNFNLTDQSICMFPKIEDWSTFKKQVQSFCQLIIKACKDTGQELSRYL